MTPATKLLKKQKIAFTLHEYIHDKNSASYGLEAVEKLGISSEWVFKTLVVALDNGELVVAILPVAEKLSMKLVAKTFSAKKVQMADKEDVLRSTGYVMGGVSPLGQKKRLKTVINSSAFDVENIFVSAGKRGLEVQLKAIDLQSCLGAKKENICL
ncbi:Cys-tRNA(Pro) deacylase [Psychromonas sp. Urea-02u-13]|uniref:Cys-tRNA(Pro) deacylase n=1 Tax=Psychromonas sp. Urea-02u-13 TaxID=2058326 RepID=UPI000C32244B|nr:Cys-tRNA(Pro) deacylase [Psychromonas sp. Urea-02u-13]PKG39989.1 Cys-tRNA(Pro) deacylase [Psychromonas sp. Urea-02u-13]